MIFPLNKAEEFGNVYKPMIRRHDCWHRSIYSALRFILYAIGQNKNDYAQKIKIFLQSFFKPVAKVTVFVYLIVLI